MKMVRDKRYIDESDFEGPIDEVIERLSGWKDQYLDARIVAEPNWDSTEWYISFNRPETEAEKNRRIKKAKQAAEKRKRDKERQIEHELKELERLTKKYGT